MKFISTWSVPQGTFNAAVARFLETGGAPPEGVKMLGRWHGMDGKGFAISESTDPKAMYRWPMVRPSPVDRHPVPGRRRRGRGNGFTTQALTFIRSRPPQPQFGSGGTTPAPPVIVGNSIRLASKVESGNALG